MITAESVPAGAAPPTRSRRRPDIVYLHSHDTGRETSPYGAPVSTPHLQALAERGTTFRQAFAVSPTCSPSRSGLLTGQWPHQNGMLGLAHRGHRLHHPQRHLAAVLAGHGYTTALAGLQHLTADRDGITEMGYQEVIGAADTAEQAAVRFIEEPHQDPFFLDVGFFETHRHAETVAFHADAVHGDPRYAPAPPGLPDTPATRADYADYATSVARLDDKVGRVLSALERSGRLSDTVVIVTTDHGIPFPRAKANANDHGLGVGLIIAGREEFAGGRVIDDLVSQLDLFPTLCDLAGTAHPEWIEGRSLLPLLAGDPTAAREEVFGEHTFHVVYEPVRTVRTTRYRYTRRFDQPSGPVRQNCDDSLTTAALAEAGWWRTAVATEELFDLGLDPAERDNRIDDPALAETAETLRRRLDRWMVATADPLLDGPLPEPVRPPPGATTTPETDTDNDTDSNDGPPARSQRGDRP